MRPSGYVLTCGLLAFALVCPAVATARAPAADSMTATTIRAVRPAMDDAVPRIALWPGDIPDAAAGRIVERSDDPARPDRAIDEVRVPYLAVYVPERPNGTALLVTPGGGYARIVLDKEGTALVPAFVEEAGITLFVLRYRLPGNAHAEGADAPLADAQRAMRLIRAHAGDWNIVPDHIGVMGFSAGGHVAARLATTYDAVYAPVDATDALAMQPDFALLVYPVISMDPAIAHAGSRIQLLGARPGRAQEHAQSPQRHVDDRTPPLFLLHAQDDEVVPVANTLAMHAAALDADVPTSLHVFPRGGHGFGTRGATGALSAWPRLAIDWIEEQTSP